MNAPRPIFQDEPADLPAPVALMRASIAILLATIRLDATSIVPDADYLAVCRDLGIRPPPRDREAALRSLLYVGPGLLSLFSSPPAEYKHAFEHWKLALGRQDTTAAAHWLSQVGLWPPQPEH